MNRSLPRIAFLPRLYDRLVNALSFSSELYKLRRELNSRIDAPRPLGKEATSHPQGVSRWFKRRRITIAESYIRVASNLQAKSSKARLRALWVMVEASFHAKTLDLPLNTARVQLALIKEAIKHKNNRRRQLELLQDFSVSSHGQHQVIRRLLDELDIVELAETGGKLKNLDAGWDSHVHDTATYGRKNPTQLLVDAFIKGISRLTIVHSSIASVGLMKEAVEAGRVVGIRVDLAIELSILERGHRFHFLAILPHFKSGKEAGRWFKSWTKAFSELLEGLRMNQHNRAEAVRGLLRDFNATWLDELNRGFPENELYILPKLRFKELADTTPSSSLNFTHLGEFLYSRYKPLLFNRVMFLKLKRESARAALRRKTISLRDFKEVDGLYARTREEYRTLNPDKLRKKYFANPALGDYQTVFTDIGGVHAILKETGCSLRVVHPLEYGPEAAARLLEANRGKIDEVEIYNNQEAACRDPEEVLAFARLVNELNAQSLADGTAPYFPVCGSNSTGRDPSVPGMGFIREDKISGKRRAAYTRRHIELPALVSAMLAAGGKPVSEGGTVGVPGVFCLGKKSGDWVNSIGDETEAENGHIRPWRAWRYLNPTLVNLMYSFVGFLVAQRFIGSAYAFLWLFITGFRNSIADLVAGRGTRVSAWSYKNVNFDNVARSLFWTGFSVPIMAFVKDRFDLLWPLAAQGFVYNLVKFFFIAISNGLYLASHNTLRGFDRKVVRANFFRSIIAWPMATVTAPVAKWLGIPSIVHSKIWSDIVAGFIEGGSKYLKTLGLRRRDIEGILPQLIDGDREDRFTALLDLLFMYREEPRTENSLLALLAPESGLKMRKKGDRDGSEYSFDDFSAAVMVKDADDELAGHILSTYPPDMATDLIDLVSSTMPDFRDWVLSCSRRLKRQGYQ